MSNNNDKAMTRREELIADSSLLGLSVQEAEELRGLDEQDDGTEQHELDLAAALLHEALLTDNDLVEMPHHLRDSIMQSARFQVRPQNNATAPAAAPRNDLERWLLPIGAAAALVLAVVGIFAFSNAPAADTPAEVACISFEKKTADLATCDWKTVEKGFADVKGYVSWSKKKQSGYMHLKGLPRNTPSTEQYQLWIVDGDREGAPVDGGVFNVDSNGEVVIPIDAKLKVTNAKVFVITKEVPGGVVVSKGPHLVLAAL